MESVKKFVVRKSELVSKAVLKGKATAPTTRKKPSTLKTFVNLSGTKALLIDALRTAAAAFDLTAAYEAMPIKYKGLIKEIVAIGQPLGGIPVPTPALDEAGKEIEGKQEVTLGFDPEKLTDTNLETWGRVFIGADIRGNAATLYIEAYDPRFERFAEFSSVDKSRYPDIRFYDGPTAADKKHVFVQFNLTEITNGAAKHKIQQLVTLAAEAVR